MANFRLPFAVKALSSVFAFCFTIQSQAALVTVQVDAYIDGSSFLKIQGNTVWWEHETFSAPGEWEHGPVPPSLPTIVNGHEWFPDWSALHPYGNPFEPCVATGSYGCSSDQVSGLLPALAAEGQSVLLTIIDARGGVTLVNPAAGNGYTASIYFDDYFGGAEWYSIALTYNTSEVPVPAAAWLFGTGLVGLAGCARRRKTA